MEMLYLHNIIVAVLICVQCIGMLSKMDDPGATVFCNRFMHHPTVWIENMDIDMVTVYMYKSNKKIVTVDILPTCF